MRDNWTDVISDAEEAFWKVIADGTPESTSGDLAPDVAATFTKACEDAAIAWYATNVRSFDVTAFCRAVQDLPAYNGWTAAYDFPGYLAFRRDGFPYELLCTPETEDGGFIAFDAVNPSTGESHPSKVQHEIAWPVDGRTVEGFMAIMRPLLDQWGALASKPEAPATSDLITWIAFNDACTTDVEELAATGSVRMAAKLLSRTPLAVATEVADVLDKWKQS